MSQQVTLTGREYDILELISEGYSNKQIAQELVLSVGTVKWYNKQIYSKLSVKNRTQAIIRAHELNLLDSNLTQVTPFKRHAQHNLPAQLTPFVGRKQELDDIGGLLEAARLVTITGAGARLVMEFAYHHLNN